jgi:hypothetical protein
MMPSPPLCNNIGKHRKLSMYTLAIRRRKYLQVKMVGWLVQQQKGRLHEERARKGDAHTPPSRELSRFLSLHLGREAKAMENRGGTDLGHVGVHGIESGGVVGQGEGGWVNQEESERVQV